MQYLSKYKSKIYTWTVNNFNIILIHVLKKSKMGTEVSMEISLTHSAKDWTIFKSHSWFSYIPYWRSRCFKFPVVSLSTLQRVKINSKQIETNWTVAAEYSRLGKKNNYADIFVCRLAGNDAVMKTGRKRNNRAAAVTWTCAKASWECLSS